MLNTWNKHILWRRIYLYIDGIKRSHMNRTRHAYNLCAENFEKKISGNIEYKEQITKFAGLLPKRALLLDIGCGPGLNAEIFAKNGLNVTGFDFSEEMIKLARKNCPKGTFILSSIENFSSDVKFDGICLSFVIVHLKTDEATSLLDRLSSFINPKGKVYISFMTEKKPGYETTSFSKNKIFFNYFQKTFIISCFEKNGFSLISSETAPYKESDGSITEDVFLIFEYKTDSNSVTCITE